jgi:Calcineurin-like phosphoesterase.
MKKTNRLHRTSIILFAFLIFALCCSHNQKDHKQKNQEQQQQPSGASPARDWNRFPAIVERDTDAEVMALGDIHGGYARLVNLLSTAGLIRPDQQSPAGYSWSGANRLLVCVGDVIDKGDHSLEVIDLLMALEAQAQASGGALIITLGNHEAEFLANPWNKKADEFRLELKSRGINPESLPRGENAYGTWMMNRPFAARVNDWFFAHGGNTSGKTIEELGDDFRQAVDKRDWGSPTLIDDSSLLEAREWWKQDAEPDALLDQYLKALKTRHIVFGHDPSAFHHKGEIGQQRDGRIFLIDVGMSPAIDYSQGALLLIDTINQEVVATSLDASGKRKEVWRGGGSLSSR